MRLHRRPRSLVYAIRNTFPRHTQAQSRSLGPPASGRRDACNVSLDGRKILRHQYWP